MTIISDAIISLFFSASVLSPPPPTISPASYGGYDYQFVDTVPSKYICSICSKVLREAHLTACCGQHFCASCLTHWLGTLQGRKTCPHCREKNFQHIPNKAMIREVNQFNIRCTNHSEGCGWVGELGGLKSHLDSGKGCGYVKVTCTYKGCGERVSRKDLQTHLQEKCYYRPYECEHCGHKDTYAAITGETKNRFTGGHYSECPDYPQDCHNRCGVTGIRRRAMPDHHSSCPLEPLDCPFKDAGCTEKIARKDMEDHMTANQQKHILEGYHSFQQLKRDLQNTKEELHETKEELQKTKKEHQGTKQELQVVKQELLVTKEDLFNQLQITTVGLRKIGAILTLRVRNFCQLRKEKKPWHSPPFIIGDMVRLRLSVYPSGVGRGQGSHVSLSLIIEEVQKGCQRPQYKILITVIGKCRSSPFTYEECTTRDCQANSFSLSGGSSEMFLKIEEANSLLEKDTLALEVKRLQHYHMISPP